VVDDDDPRPGPGRGARQGSRRRCVVHRRPPARRRVSRRPEAAVHAWLRARRRRRGARRGLLEAAGGRPCRRADGMGRRRGECLRAGEVRGRGGRGPRPGGGRESRSSVHDRLPVASLRGEGEERGDGARTRRSRQGGHRSPRARSAGRASPLRDCVSSRPRRGRAARRRCDRLPQRGFPGPGAATSPGKVPTLCSTGSAARCRFAPSVRCGPAEGLSCSATPRRSRRGIGADERGSSGTRGPQASFSGACSRPAGASTATGSTSSATATRSVPGGLPRATRAASSWRDPSGRCRASAAHRGPPCARVAGELGDHGKARARPMTKHRKRGVFRRRARKERL
jgi:hypothetical protein